MLWLLLSSLIFAQQAPSGVPVAPGKSPVAPSSEEETFKIDPKIPQWSCRLDSQPKDGAFTVGEVFILACEGEAVQFDTSGVSFLTYEKNAYLLNILKAIKLESNEAIFEATSYRVGKVDLSEVVAAVGESQKFRLGGLIIPMKSVMNPAKPQKEAFGPIGPMKLSYPKWLWLSIIGVLVLVIGWSVFSFRRRVQRKKVLEELKKHNTALGAYNQFNKDLRHLNRKYIFSKHKKWNDGDVEKYVMNLDEIFRMYLLREFVIPALDWKTGLVVKHIKREDKKNWIGYGDSLFKFLKELDRAQNEVGKVKMEDCQQLTQMARKVTQHIWQKRKAGVKS